MVNKKTYTEQDLREHYFAGKREAFRHILDILSVEDITINRFRNELIYLFFREKYLPNPKVDITKFEKK